MAETAVARTGSPLRYDPTTRAVASFDYTNDSSTVAGLIISPSEASVLAVPSKAFARRT
jgi:hypothetical protein